MKIIILTGSSFRHTFFRKYLAGAKDVSVVKTFCEDLDGSLEDIVQKDAGIKNLREKHLIAREKSEEDFIRLFVESTPDISNPVTLKRGKINEPQYTENIISEKPDLLIAYGCSIIKEPLLSAFKGHFLNVHLGLAPYYRGGGTNFWPLVNQEPEYAGATFMHIDAGIDTGQIIHQIRASYSWGDTPSQIGNRLIRDMADVYLKIIFKFGKLASLPQLPVPDNEHYYRKRDYTEESVEKLYANFADGMIERYLNEREERCRKAPILINPAL